MATSVRQISQKDGAPKGIVTSLSVSVLYTGKSNKARNNAMTNENNMIKNDSVKN